MHYEELEPIDRAEAATELGSGDQGRVCTALVRIALFDTDRPWVEDRLAQFLHADDPWTRGVAAICVGHVARIHRALDVARFLPLLRKLLGDPATAGKAQDALDDIDVFITRRAKRPS